MKKNLKKFQFGNSWISQADFARLLGVTGSTIQGWVTGKHPMSGPAEAYFRLLSRVPGSIIDEELAHINLSSTPFKGGIYLLKFVGAVSDKDHVLFFDRGIVFGGSTDGIQFDGKYQFDPKKDSVQADLKITFPAGRSPFHGLSNYGMEWSFTLPLSLPVRMTSPHILTHNTPLGTAQVMFACLRENKGSVAS